MKKIRLFLLIGIYLFFVPLSVKAADTVSCVPVVFNGHSYKLFTENADYETAKSNCEKVGGHLVTINSQAENEFISSIIKTSLIWIGGYGESNGWAWVTGEKWGVYTHWGSYYTATSSKAVYMYPNGNWFSESKKRSYPYICEWETVNTEAYHEYKITDEYVKIDNDSHKRVSKCKNCDATILSTSGTPHTWEQSSPFITKNSEDYHDENYYCSTCNAEKKEQVEHEWEPQYKFTKIDNLNHGQLNKCKICGEEKTKSESHNWEHCGRPPYMLDKTYHHNKYYCYDCGAERFDDKEKHSLEYNSNVKVATLHSIGIAKYYCGECDCYVNKTVSWKYRTYYSADYDPWFSYIYRSSKSVTVHFDYEAKGAVVKLKIGKKTYKKTIKNSKHSIKFKIKKPSYGKKIQATIYYKGRLIGKSETDRVLYAKKIKKGMTKKQVRYTKGWGSPDNIGTYSNGWSYWFYDNGAHVGFKNGKVKTWYK